MERWLLVAVTDCSDPSREEEFNQYYDTVHAPDVLETPGILRATRFAAPSPTGGKGRYLALYDVETDDIDQTEAKFGEIITKKWEQGRMSELLTIHSVAFYRQLGPSIQPTSE